MDGEAACRRPRGGRYSRAAAAKDVINFLFKMLSQRYRLSKENDFQRLFARGRRIHTPPLSFVIAPNNMTRSRFAVVIGVAVTKQATKRNTLRRRISGHLQTLLPFVSAGYDCAFIVRAPALALQRKRLCAAVETLLRKGALLPPLSS